MTPYDEYKSFYRTFMVQKAAKYYNKHTQNEIGKLIGIVNKLKADYEKRIDKLNHKLQMYILSNKTFGYLKTERNINVLNLSIQQTINECLFLELKTGLLYN